MIAVVPVALSAAGFSALHLILKKGGTCRALAKVFKRRQDAGHIPAIPSAELLASQAEARIVNEIHNVMVLPFAFAALFHKTLNADKMHGVSGYARALSLVSAGYFLTDMAIVSTHFSEHGPEPLIHAVICVTFFAFSAVKQRMQFFVPRVLMFELSTPFVHARWLLKVLGLSKTGLYKTNGLAMLASFFGCRIVWGSTMARTLYSTVGHYLSHPRPDRIRKSTVITVTAAGTSIMVLNYFWFYKMVRGAIVVFGRGSRKRLAAASPAPGSTAAAVNQGAGSAAADQDTAGKSSANDGAVNSGGPDSGAASSGGAAQARADVDALAEFSEMEVIDIPEDA